MSFSDRAVIDLGITPQPRRPHLGPHPHSYLYKGGIGLHFVTTRTSGVVTLCTETGEVGQLKQIE